MYLSALSCYRTAVKPRHPGGHWWWRPKTVWAVTTDNIAVVQEKWWSMIKVEEGRKHKLCALQKGIPRRMSKERLSDQYLVLSCLLHQSHIYICTQQTRDTESAHLNLIDAGKVEHELKGRIWEVQDLHWVPFFIRWVYTCDHDTTERALYSWDQEPR